MGPDSTYEGTNVSTWMGDRTRLGLCAVAVVAAGLALGRAVQVVRAADDIITEFKYGSIGTEGTVGLPYWIYKVLPEVFADKLPARGGAGWERVGFTYETPGADLPLGTTKSDDWVPRVGLNCATCHAGAYREVAGGPARVVLGMPSHQMDLQAYARFLSAAAHDPRFNAETLVAAMKKHSEFGFLRRARLQLAGGQRDEKGDPRTRRPPRVVRHPPAAGARPRRYVQPVQGDVPRADAFRHRHQRRDRRSAVAVEPADPRGALAALGRQQQLGRRTEQERGDWRRGDA
jgi:hypothetical protein